MKIAMLVSGGVDSSVALCLLKEQGHEVVAFYLKIWLDDELSFLGECPWEQDLKYVRQVCDKLNVPLQIVSLQQDYQTTIIAYMIDQIRQGNTPNPDILCNQFIKFGLFLDKIDASFDRVATGHYAQIEFINNVGILKQSPDAVKDQTYFLCRLNQEQQARCLFPIGHLTKNEVRAYAHHFDLPNKDRKDSQGLCFLGKFKFRDFIQHHLGTQEGNLVDCDTNKIVGTHAGFWFYTIGQRQGIRLGGGPWYVVAKNAETNTVYISRAYYDVRKVRKSIEVKQCVWSQPIPLTKEINRIKLRHGAQFHRGYVTVTSPTECSIELEENDQGIASGQFAVFYCDSYCVGSGVISNEAHYWRP